MNEILNQTDVIVATDAQATDEAVLMLTRRLRRTNPDAYNAVITSLPEGLRDALRMAEDRADAQRQTDKRDGITRHVESVSDRIDREIAAEGDAE